MPPLSFSRIFFFFCVFMLLNACTKSGATTTFVNPDAVTQLTARGAIVLDVRTPAEFASGHIRGARNISIDSGGFPAAAQKLDKEKAYIVHCSANVPKGRTDRAIGKLRSAGLTNLSSMVGGIEAWKKLGLPVE